MSDIYDIAQEAYQSNWPDYWRLLRETIKNAHAMDQTSVVLIRFALQEDDAKTLHHIVQNEAENILAPQDIMVAFDDISFVLVANKNNEKSSAELATELVKCVGLQLMSGPFSGASVSIEQIIKVSENSIEVDEISIEEFLRPPSAPVQTPNQEIDLLGTASFDFLPIWHVRRNFVMCFECIPRWHLEDGRILDESDVSERFRAHQMEYALDAQTVHHAVDQLIDVIDHDSLASVLVPIHYDSVVEDEGFELFLHSYRELMPIWRERMSMEIKCIPPTASADDIRKALHRLRPFCNALYLQVDFGFDRFADFAADGFVSIGVDLTHDERAEADIIKDMEKFISDAGAFDTLHTHALGLKTVSLSVAAICAGFDYIGSQPITKELEGWGMDDFLIRPIDLYKQFLKNKKAE